MQNLVKGLFAAAIAFTALSATSKAQTVAINAVGSSAQFLELGEAAVQSSTLGASCVWSTGTNSIVTATDNTLTSSTPNVVNPGPRTDTGSAWIAWTPGSNGCTSPDSTVQIYSYLSTDSVVGNRCLFNGCKVTINNSTTPTNSGLISVGTAVSTLPTAIVTAFNTTAGTGTVVNLAGSDIRPEDAEFAITRGTTNCGTAVVTGSQYLGLGYAPGTTIDSNFSTSTFNVIPFTLPSSFSVTPLGVAPVMVVVNGDSGTTGFNSISNISSATLAKFLDGTYSYVAQVNSPTTMSGPSATIIVREPLSGTYNTMEYNEPNTTVAQTSQDVGLTQLSTQRNCNGGTSVLSNPMDIATNNSGGARERAIGTGQELSEVIASTDSLGYSFWGVSNFKGYTSTLAPKAKYLTVDGIDPLLDNATDTATFNGTLPLAGTAEMGDVNFAHLSDGTYPIWSLLRLVTTSSAATTAAQTLAAEAQAIVTADLHTTAGPDFLPASGFAFVRSHFNPPTEAFTPADGPNPTVVNSRGANDDACTSPEAGGDVGGVVLAASADSSFCTAHGVTTGQTGQRR